MREEPLKIKLNFRISSKVFEKMQVLVNNGEYEDISDVIVSALHDLLEKSQRAETVEETVTRYLESDRGRDMIRGILIRDHLLPAGYPGQSQDLPNAVSEPRTEYPKKSGKKRPTKKSA